MRYWKLRQEEKDNLRVVMAFTLFVAVILSIFSLAVRMGPTGRAEEGKKSLWGRTTIRYHSNYPGGKDLIFEMTCRGKKEITWRHGDRLMAYAALGFGGYTPLRDGWTWYMDRECVSPFRKLYLYGSGSCELYAGWRMDPEEAAPTGRR